MRTVRAALVCALLLGFAASMTPPEAFGSREILLAWPDGDVGVMVGDYGSGSELPSAKAEGEPVVDRFAVPDSQTRWTQLYFLFRQALKVVWLR